MAFIRIKHISNKPYAYLVKNKWTKKGPRQKSSKYLGQVISLNDREFYNEKDFRNHIFQKYKIELEHFIDKNNPREILDEMVFFELSKRNFKEYKGKRGTKKKSMIRENIIVDLHYLKIYEPETKKPIVLSINGDFMCEYSLKKLYNFWEHGTEMEVAQKLAKYFIFAGIAIEDEVFVVFFQKTYKNDSLRIW